jgi:hypothetical protein
MTRSGARSKSLRGTCAIFFCASMNLADVPKCVIRSSAAYFHRTRPCSMNGEPSYSSSVAPEASPETSQFHIIHPQVVK